MIDIPSVIHRDSNGNERAVSLATRLLKDRIVMLTGQIDDDLAEAVILQLRYLESEDATKPITMVCSGPGGSVTAGFGIIDTMELLRCPVHTTVVGQVASMSSLIALSGEKGQRKIYPKARVMLHSVSSGTQGTVHDMKTSYDETMRLNDVVFEHLAKCTGKKVATLKKQCERDLWLSADEAVAYGCCDSVMAK